MIIAKLLLGISLLTLSFAPVYATGMTASASDLFRICDDYSASDPNEPTVCREISDLQAEEQETGDNQVTRFLGDVIDILLWALGIASVLAIFVGGLTYVTSAGDSQKAVKARNIIIYALVGVTVALLSSLIIYYVIETFFE